MFKVRLLSGIVLVLLMIGVLYAGGTVTLITILLLSLGGSLELLRIYNLHNKLMGYISYIATISYFVLLATDNKEYVVLLLILFVLAVLSIYVVTYPEYTDRDAMATILSFFYVSIMLSYVYQIRELESGGALVVMIFICSWVNDTCAYCVGVTMGKHKMSPKLSPKKSVEGLIGGILGSAIVASVYGVFFNANVCEIENSPVIFAVIGACGAGMAVIGDLAASAIKRNNDIKDYGKLIPGHGGILDRFDSIIFTAPIVYYGFVYLIDSV